MENLTQGGPVAPQGKKSQRSEAAARPADGGHDRNPQMLPRTSSATNSAPVTRAPNNDNLPQRKADELALARWEEEGGRVARGFVTPYTPRSAIMAHDHPAPSVTFGLAEIADELAREPAFVREGHTARTLVRSSDLRVLLVALEAGKKIAEHHADVTATIQVLRGHVRVGLWDREEELGPGQLLLLAPGTRHELHALADSAFVLTLAWAGHRPPDAGLDTRT
jgi:quercetin dioxygenase-like cupin family protein